MTAAVAATFVLATGLPANAVRTGDVYQRPVDPITRSFAKTTIEWHGLGETGETMVVYGVEERGGRVAVCGMYLTEGSFPRQTLRKGLSLSSISSGGHVLVSDLRYFNEFTGGQGDFLFSCTVTQFGWDPRFGNLKPKYEQGAEFRDPSR